MAAIESCELNSASGNGNQKPQVEKEVNSIQIESKSKIDEPTLSKRARKRLLKHEKWLEYRPIKRVLLKVLFRLKYLEENKLVNLSKEYYTQIDKLKWTFRKKGPFFSYLETDIFGEVEDFYWAKEKERIKKKREEARLKNIELGPSRKQLKNMNLTASKSKLRIVLDFSFDHLMTDKDLNKCVNQMSRCYSINRRAEKPLQLHVTNFDGKSKEIMQKHIGYHNWDVNFWTENYLDIFKKEELFYLTSDSDNVVENLDDSSVYIIGALVDHNYHKGICLRKAKEQCIKHGRLPIGKFLEMKSRKVLTVDHVYAILVNVASNGMTWKEAFLKVIPQRKGALAKPSADDDEQETPKLDVAQVKGNSCDS